MEFSISADMQELLGQIAEFTKRALIPRERDFMAKGFLAIKPDLERLRTQVKKLGLWAPQASREFGGMGLSLIDYALVSETLGQTPFGHYVFGCQAPDAGNIEILHRYGTEEQKMKYLIPLVRGEIRSCFSMTERDSPGSNPTQLECTAVKEGADYVIDGEKWFTTAADGAAFAIVMAVTNPEAPPHLRASQIIVPTTLPGFHRVRNISVMGHVGEDYASHAQIRYERCRVPQANPLGRRG